MSSKKIVVVGLVSVFSLWGTLAQAGTTKIDIAVTPKKEEGDKKKTGYVTKEQVLYQYTVKLKNSSFAAVSGLSAQYRVFIRDDSGKGSVSQQKLKRREFSAAVPDMPNAGAYSFETEPVTLEKTVLDGMRYYKNGKRNISADKVAGVWIRIMQGDKVVGEYINPSTLAAKEKF